MIEKNAGVPSKLTSNVAAWKAFFAERWTEASVACRFAHCAVRQNAVALVNAYMSGRYKCVVRKISDIDNATQVLEFSNLITDIGLERWGSDSIGNKCFIGSGSTPPTVNDTALVAQLASSTATVDLTTWKAYSAAERWTEATIVYRFSPGVTLNSIAEVGVGWVGGLWSRALIRDQNGNPITIQLLSDEVLDVYYTLRIQFPEDASGSITIDGVAYDWILRPAELANWPDSRYTYFYYPFSTGGDAKASTAEITQPNTAPGWSGSSSSTTVVPYVTSSRKRTMTFKFDLNDANFNIKSVILRPGSGSYPTTAWQLGFYQGGVSVGVPKVSSKRFSLTFDFSWGRA